MSGGHGRHFFCPPTVGVCLYCSIIVCFWHRVEEENELCCLHFRELVVCKAVSLDIASIEERFSFFHSLGYTLINLLKAATPVSSSLTHLKRQTALNPTRIFSMDASEKNKNWSRPPNDSFLSQGLKMKRKGRQAHSSSFLLIVVGQRGTCRGL